MQQAKYSRKNYPSRGKKPERDYLSEYYLTQGFCEICGATLIRKTSPKGISEQWRRFLRRKTCGKVYNEKGGVELSFCLRKWMSIPENNGRYIGILHIPCSICGKQGLSYRNSGNKYDMCGKCWNENRPSPWNKKDIPNFNCKLCGKDCVGRNMNGKIKYTQFCSKLCSNQYNFSKNET